MSLQNRLDAIKKSFAEQAPDEIQQQMARATEELRATGIAERAIGTGDTAPAFTLPRATDGTAVSLADLRERGPVVLTFYRGHW